MPVCSCPNGPCNCNSVPLVPEPEEGQRCEDCNNLREDFCERCGVCANCCTRYNNCVNCDNCDRRVNRENACDNCGECSRCCTCYNCPNCGNNVEDENFCTDCDSCSSCCSCEEESIMHCGPLAPKLYMPNGKDLYCHQASLKDHKYNPSSRLCSAEIEVAKLNDRTKSDKILDACIKWGAGIVSDGSLPDTGFEINTTPAAGDKYTKQIDDICNGLELCGANFTDACGLHVHVDARDFSYWEVRRLIILYAKIEDALFSIVSTKRRNSNYCRRCGEEYLKAIRTGSPKKIKAAVCKAVYKEENIKNRRAQKYDEARYGALNLHSWFYRGTVECRLFGGEVNGTKIKNWGILWCGILDWVYTHKEKHFVKFDKLSSIEVLLDVCPTEDIRKWVNARFEYCNPPIDS